MKRQKHAFLPRKVPCAGTLTIPVRNLQEYSFASRRMRQQSQTAAARVLRSVGAIRKEVERHETSHGCVDVRWTRDGDFRQRDGPSSAGKSVSISISAFAPDVSLLRSQLPLLVFTFPVLVRKFVLEPIGHVWVAVPLLQSVLVQSGSLFRVWIRIKLWIELWLQPLWWRGLLRLRLVAQEHSSGIVALGDGEWGRKIPLAVFFCKTSAETIFSPCRDSAWRVIDLDESAPPEHGAEAKLKIGGPANTADGGEHDERKKCRVTRPKRPHAAGRE